MSTPVRPQESVPALKESERLLYTFAAPSRTMADLRRNASWWVPWLLVSIASMAFVFALDKKIGWAQVLETQMRSNPKAAAQIEEMAPDLREKVLKIQETSARVLGYVAPVTTLLMLVVVAALMMAIFNFGFGAKLRFQEMIGVAAYSFLPSILSTGLMTVMLFLVPPERFDLKNSVATSVGYFVPATMPFLKTLLGIFDVFILWEVFLLAVGVSQLSKVKQGTAFATIFVVLLLCKLASAAMGTT
jgi:hypothetical protein